MSLHEGESINYEGALHGKSWLIQPTHAGHTITVIGPIVRNGEEVPIVMAECSCGDRFRMSSHVAERALARGAVAL